jgi:hypothetical protein
MSILATIAACLAVAGCGGRGAPSATPSSVPAAAAASTTKPAPAAGTPIFPTVTADQRTQLARYALVRAAPATVREACGKVAEQTEWLVLCPTRVPGGRLMVSAATGVAGKSTDFSEGYELSLDSGALRENGAPDPGHWTIAAGTASAMHDQLTAYGHSEPVGRRRLKVNDITVTRYREPAFGEFPGIYGGHIMYQWSQGKAVMQVSVHGTTHERVLRGLVLLLSEGPDPSPTD